MPGLEGRRPDYLHANRFGSRCRRSARGSARAHRRAFGDEYLPEKANVYKIESRRPGRARSDSADFDAARSRDGRPYLTPDQYSLYRLIWNRFVASQMLPATFDETTVDVTAGGYLFRVKGTVPKFAGWMAVYGTASTPTRRRSQKTKHAEQTATTARRSRRPVGPTTKTTSACRACCHRWPKEIVWNCERCGPSRNSPSRRLALRKRRWSRSWRRTASAGRSTYASIIAVLQDREYVNKLEGRFKPTALGS